MKPYFANRDRKLRAVDMLHNAREMRADLYSIPREEIIEWKTAQLHAYLQIALIKNDLEKVSAALNSPVGAAVENAGNTFQAVAQRIEQRKKVHDGFQKSVVESELDARLDDGVACLPTSSAAFISIYPALRTVRFSIALIKSGLEKVRAAHNKARS